MSENISRRSFVKWSAAAAGVGAAAGLTACAPAAPEGEGQALSETGFEEKGQWLYAPCYNNCGGNRCVNKVYVEDGVVLKVRSEEGTENTFAMPQHRSCPRGRAKASQILSAARIKYPMKRKSFSLDDPHGELRGIDEWERISWDEALDLVAEGTRRIYDNYGPQAMLCGASSNISLDNYYDQNVCLLNALGGAVHIEAGTVSFGSFSVAETHMFGGWGSVATPSNLQLKEAELHVFFGCNWTASRAGYGAWLLNECRARGAKVIFIDPWLNQTAQGVADQWIPVAPGTDVALMQAICYEWIKNGTYDQEFLDKYCIGFDGDHMPEGAPENASWKDYIMGTGYDMTEKTPEWAEAICGVPADTIRELAAEIGNTDKVSFFMSLAVSKIPAGEQVVQTYYTMALMHGGIGTPGHYFGRYGGQGGSSGGAMIAGANVPVEEDPAAPLSPQGAPVYMYYPIPQFDVLGDSTDWLDLEPSECWRSILAGEYGRDCWPGGKRKIDIRGAFFGGFMSSMNQVPDTMNAIKAVRGFEFVWGVNPFFDSTRQYCDVVLPCTSMWEKPGRAFNSDYASVMWFDKIMDPLYESKPEAWIAEELAKRLGIDPYEVNKHSDEERCFMTLRDAVCMDPNTFEAKPFFTITQEELDELYPTVDAQPQEGEFTLAEFREYGILKAARTEDTISIEPFAEFIADPEGSPLPTQSGKFEIYCQSLAYMINSVGYSTIAPIGMYQVGDPEWGVGTYHEDYPLRMWTPHGLRRAHSVNDETPSLREAMPQEFFMSEVDAKERGIENGDIVLITSPYGKVLRPAKVLSTVVPGGCALQDGGWFRIDEETGIDLGGCPNVLEAPKSSGGGCQAFTANPVQVEKYTGPLELLPDKNTPAVVPVGIE